MTTCNNYSLSSKKDNLPIYINPHDNIPSSLEAGINTGWKPFLPPN